jgi:hypothetical protein
MRLKSLYDGGRWNGIIRISSLSILRFFKAFDPLDYFADQPYWRQVTELRY